LWRRHLQQQSKGPVRNLQLLLANRRTAQDYSEAMQKMQKRPLVLQPCMPAERLESTQEALLQQEEERQGGLKNNSLSGKKITYLSFE
jgi:hypothetical protein